MSDAQYVWTDFYSKFADKLRPYRSDRQALIAVLKKVYEDIGMKLPKLEVGELVDIDPFTIFGLFNKGISDTNRKKVIAGFSNELNIEAELPNSFDGIPTLNNLKANYYWFLPGRGELDIDNLWALFVAALDLVDSPSEVAREAFVAAYDTVLTQRGIKWNMSMGLYWMRPYAFLSLDSRNRWYIGDMALAGSALAEVAPKEKSGTVPGGKEYLSICDIARSQLGSETCLQEDFPALSYAAWLESERVNKEKKEAAKVAEDNALGDADVETTHYWLYAPGEGAARWGEFYERGVMGLGWGDMGDLNAYGSKEEMRQALLVYYSDKTSQKNSAHALWQFAHDVKPGDVIFAKRGRTEILGCGIVEGGYEYREDGGYYPHLRAVRWTRKGSWHNDEMFAMKTLTDVTDYPDFVAKIEAFFEDDADEVIDVEEPTVNYPEYSKELFLSEVYMDEARYDTLTGVLRSKKNIILQGAPGVGKTFVAKRLAYSMMGVKDASRVMMVQFHQSYSYEDFIEGYRPSADGFELVKGAFYTFCKKAQEDTDNDYFFVIDEINRGNLSKIFGELFMLIESDKRGQKNKLQLLYSRELFYVPGNVHIIGMMNTADRSLAMLDYALRRRFAFFDLEPGFATEGFREYRSGIGSKKLDALVQAVERLNEAIADDESLGDGFRIGHSYFCGMEPGGATEAKLSSIVEYELVAMLKEYWFDEPVKVREWSGRLRGALK